MRKWMIEMREEKGFSLRKMSVLCDCSRTLLYIVECGGITHPDIASDIARAYGMNVHQYNQLVSEERRAKVIPKHRPKPASDGKSILCYGGGV